MADPFANIIERDLAEKCSTDASEVLLRAFQLCETRRGCVVVGVAGVAGAVAALAGAFYASYPDELTDEIIDTFWRDMIRDVVRHSVQQTSGPLGAIRADVARKPAQ